MVKQLADLSSALTAGERAVLLTCFLYDAPAFVPPRSPVYGKTVAALHAAREQGLDFWQVNFAVDECGIALTTAQRLA